jgi:hypothetical protein
VRENILLADMAYTMMVVTKMLTEEQEQPGLVMVVGCVAVCAGYLLIRLRTYLINEDRLYLKVRLSSSEDDCEEKGEGEDKPRQSLRTKMNNIYLSVTIPFHRDKRKVL